MHERKDLRLLPEVVFVNTPFLSPNRPALGASLLQAELSRVSRESRVLYLNIMLAARIGAVAYSSVADDPPVRLLGEWLFSPWLWTDDPEEGSRGCWWGQHENCVFCGLNGAELKHRQKSVGRAVSEIAELWDNYGHLTREIAATDNIMPANYPGSVFPRLKERGVDFEIHYEVKASLRKDEVQALAEAGVKGLQVGVESLSTQVLRIMRKGTTLITNLQCLKWMLEYGLLAHWNLLWGFPGEAPSESVKCAQLVRRLLHLPPPLGMHPVRLDRFSPLFKNAADFGIHAICPKPAYSFVYGRLSPEVVKELAYFFDFDYVNAPSAEYAVDLVHAVNTWRSRHSSAGLFHFSTGQGGVIVDTRHEPLVYTLGATCVRVLDAMDGGTRTNDLPRILSLTEEAVSYYLEALDEKSWIVRDGPSALTLSTRLGTYQPSTGVLRAMARLIRGNGAALSTSGRIHDTESGKEMVCQGREPSRAACSRAGKGPRSAHQTHLTPEMFAIGDDGSVLIRDARLSETLEHFFREQNRVEGASEWCELCVSWPC
ncbi:MAG: RiPP maturation radical SAM C-methyltransferase [bacterium]|nr:RiPP maturation radical SAM C-methyltransferase [bacterium]